MAPYLLKLDAITYHNKNHFIIIQYYQLSQAQHVTVADLAKAQQENVYLRL